MKKFLVYTLIVFSCMLIVFSCQKGIVWPSVGELTKDAANNCASIIVKGNYTINKEISDSDYLVVDVNVTLPGTYIIYTDTLNGYSFSAAGKFQTAGNFQVSLAGSGKPIAAGNNNFTVFYNESLCQAVVAVTSDAVPPAVYSFQDNEGNCLGDTVNGSYIKNIPVDTSATVTAGVNVTVPGSFTITTNTVNGYTFSATGVFTTTGVQSILLTASGTPANAATNVFSLTAATAVCNFSVPVLAATVAVTNADLFPLANNNYWVYDDLVNAGDSIKRSINGSATENSDTYYVMNEQTKNSAAQYLFRKVVSDYYEYTKIDKYTSSFQYNNEIDTTLYFLSENLTAGTAWESEEIKDIASFGQLIYVKYYFICTQANTIVTINGKAFANVYKINMQPEIKSEFAGYGSTNELYTFYYARGIGLIYTKKYNLGFRESEMQIRKWQVN